jgi:hypothetical protein
MTNQDRALAILDRLIALDVERIAMASLLDFVRDPATALPLEWRPRVRATHDQILRDIVSGKYVEMRQAIQESTPDCLDALSLLESALKGLAPIDDL